MGSGKKVRVFLCYIKTHCILCFVGVLEEAKFFGLSKAIEPLEAMVQVDAYTSVHFMFLASKKKHVSHNLSLSSFPLSLPSLLSPPFLLPFLSLSLPPFLTLLFSLFSSLPPPSE